MTQNKAIGPLLTDERFFGELLNLNFNGLEKTKEFVNSKDYKSCRKTFANFL